MPLATDPATADGPGARTRVDGVRVLGALSPTAVGEFRDCALRYRLRRLDRVPEPSAPEALRGTVVHLVLERLFDLPATERDAARAVQLVRPAWDDVVAREPELVDLVAPDALEEWLAPCRAAVTAYFALEDPRRVEPLEREAYLETVLDSGLLLRGVVDRLDVDGDGAVTVVDYKSGRSPAVGFERRALAQLRFYALVLQRSRGTLPRELRLLYLGDVQSVSYRPDEADLEATRRTVEAVWGAVQRAEQTGDWQPQPGRACGWCTFHDLCPAYGGTPPPLPAPRPPGGRSAVDDGEHRSGQQPGQQSGQESGQQPGRRPGGVRDLGHRLVHAVGAALTRRRGRPPRA